MDISINYLAVLAAAVGNMVVGFLWYGPVFGKMWMGLMGFTPDSVKSMKLSPKQAMVGGFITALIMAYVLALFVFIYGAIGVWDAVELAFWVWLGFFIPTTAGSYLWEGKPFKLFALNAAQWLVSLEVMALVLTLWQ